MTIFLLIFFILLVVYGFLIDFYRRSWNSIPEQTDFPKSTVKVSVIVAVRNEEHTIINLLNGLSAQDYPKELYQVIVVDDHSTDDTWTELSTYPYSALSTMFLQLSENVTTKKQAIATGINVSSGELIITTDADCSLPPTWISTIVSFYTSTDAQFIAAPVGMQSSSTLSGIFQSLDFLTLQGITGASVHKKFHTMCNGANLAYTKQAFFDVNGFAGIDTLPSGDDMLLMHKIYERYPDKVFYLKNKDAVVITPAENSWSDFFQQRIRWASKAVHYKDKRIFYVLLITYCVNVCFIILSVASIWNINWLGFLGLLLLAKIVIEYPFVNAVAIFFNQQRRMIYFPFLQPLHIMYTVIAGWLGRFGSYRWKLRIVKNNSGREAAKM